MLFTEKWSIRRECNRDRRGDATIRTRVQLCGSASVDVDERTETVMLQLKEPVSGLSKGSFSSTGRMRVIFGGTSRSVTGALLVDRLSRRVETLGIVAFAYGFLGRMA
jgi:hypothetical protein